VKAMFGWSLFSFVFLLKLMLFVFMYVCTTWIPYHIMFVSLNCNTTGTTRGAGTTYSFQRMSPMLPVSLNEDFWLPLWLSVLCFLFCLSSFCVLCPMLSVSWIVPLVFSKAYYIIILFPRVVCELSLLCDVQLVALHLQRRNKVLHLLTI
jgi:hypothetical protein